MYPDDPRTPAELHALDELASAIVDGEATLPADADHDLRARVAAFRAVRDAVGARVGPPSEAIREAGIAAALGASATSADVHSLATRRRRMPVLPAAAVAAALALLVGIGVLSLGDDAREAEVAGVVTTAPASDEQSKNAAETALPSTSAAAATTTAAISADDEESATPATDASALTLAPTITEAPDTTLERSAAEAPDTTLDVPDTEWPPTTEDTSTVVTSGGSDAEEVATDGDYESLRQAEVIEQAASEADDTESRMGSGASGDYAQSALDDSQDSAALAYSGFDTFTFLFPYAEEVASTIRAGEESPASFQPTIGWPPDCGIDEAEVLDGEEVLRMVRLFEGIPLVFGLLYVGPTSWVLIDAATCETFPWPSTDE